VKRRRRLFFTLGHGRRTDQELIGLLTAVGVHKLVDVRRFPRSRTNPQFNVDVFEAVLARVEPATVTPFASVERGRLIYPRRPDPP
jgi:uncharacterized protein (DUF488 family)